MSEQERQNEIFISYSRRNKAFVNEIVEGFKRRGVDPWFDREDIPKGAEWWQEIQKGIISANAFVFIISEYSLRSEVCHWELAYAIENSKKIIPVLHIDVFQDQDLMAELANLEWLTPEEHSVNANNNWRILSKINLIFLQELEKVEEGIDEILTTARTDLDYLEQHTRLLQRALRWEQEERNRSSLLIGTEVDEAEHWLTDGLSKEPRPRDLHIEYITASRDARRKGVRNYIIGLLGIVVLIFILFIISLLLAFTASDERANARRNLIEAWRIQSLFLSDLSEDALRENKPQTALLLALQSLRNFDEGIFNVKSQRALLDVIISPIQEELYLEHSSTVISAEWNADETMILTQASDEGQQIIIWATTPNPTRRVLPHDERVLGAIWNPAGDHVLTWDTTARIWDANYENTPLVLEQDANVSRALWQPETGEQILTLAEDNVVRLWNASNGEVLQTKTYESSISGIGWNNNGTYYHIRTVDNIVHIIEAASGEEITKLEHESRVVDVRWSNDNIRLLTRTNDNTVFVWNILNEDEPTLLIHDGNVKGALWNERGNRILTWSSDNNAWIWNLNNSEPISLSHNATISGATWSPNGRHVLTWTTNNTLLRWNAMNGDRLQPPPPQNTQLIGAAWSTDSNYLLTWSANGPITIWNSTVTSIVGEMAHDDFVWGAAWNSAATRILSWSSDGSARVWNPFYHDEPFIITHDDVVNGAVWNPVETRVLSWADDQTARITTIADGSQLVLDHDDVIIDGRWNMNGLLVMTRTANRLMVWDAITGEQVYALDSDDQILNAEWSLVANNILFVTNNYKAKVVAVPSGNELLDLTNVIDARWNDTYTQVLGWSDLGTVGVWNLAFGDLRLSFLQGSRVLGALLNDEETRILTWSENGVVSLWDANFGEQKLTITPNIPIQGASWNSDENRIMVWGGSPNVQIWNAESGDLVRTLEHANAIESAIWSPDGRYIVTIDTDFRATIWEVASGNRLDILTEITSARWDSESKEVLLISRENLVKIWTINTGNELMEIPHSDTVNSVYWNTAEDHILSTSGKEATIWIANIPELIAKGQSLVVRELTIEERENAFLPTPTPTVGETDD